MRTSLTILSVAILILASDRAWAQPVPSKFGSTTHVFPAGAQRGTSVDVRIGTECIPPHTRLMIWGEGVHAPERIVDRADDLRQFEPSPRRKPTEVPISYPREWTARFDVAADAPTDFVFWRLSHAQGSTHARPFLIGDLPEWIETESNSLAELAEMVSLPIVLNGRIAGERDVDYFAFDARKGDPIVCDVLARRLGSPLDPVLMLEGPDGNVVDCATVFLGSDQVLGFTPTESGRHRLRVSHVGFHGGPQYVYRITLQQRQFPVVAFPGATELRPEADATLWMLGTSGRQPLQPQTLPFADLHRNFPGFRLPVFPYAVHVDQSEQLAGAPQQIEVPAAVTGRFLTKSDRDCYAFPAQKGIRYAVACTVPLGSSAIPVLQLQNEEDKVLAKASALDGEEHTILLEWQAPADGLVRLCLQDLQFGSQGGPAFTYLMSVTVAEPGFELTASDDVVDVRQGGKTDLTLKVRRTGGFADPIVLHVEGLPEGVVFEPLEITAKQSQVKLTFKAEESTLSAGHSIRIIGSAMIDGSERRVFAQAGHSGVDPEGISAASATVTDLLLTVQHKPLFRLYCSEAYEYAYRGTVYPYYMDIERLEGFDGEILLEQGDRQNRDLDGIEILDLKVPPDDARPAMPIYLPETMHINVQSQSQLYTQGYCLFQDAAGQQQAMMVVAEKRNMLRTLPPVVKLQAAADEIEVLPGAEITLPVQLERTTNFGGEMLLELRASPDSKGVEAAAIVIPPHGVSGELRARLPAELSADRLLTLRASGKLETGATVISETQIRLRVRR